MVSIPKELRDQSNPGCLATEWCKALIIGVILNDESMANSVLTRFGETD